MSPHGTGPNDLFPTIPTRIYQKMRVRRWDTKDICEIRDTIESILQTPNRSLSTTEERLLRKEIQSMALTSSQPQAQGPGRQPVIANASDVEFPAIAPASESGGIPVLDENGMDANMLAEFAGDERIVRNAVEQGYADDAVWLAAQQKGLLAEAMYGIPQETLRRAQAARDEEQRMNEAPRLSQVAPAEVESQVNQQPRKGSSFLGGVATAHMERGEPTHKPEKTVTFELPAVAMPTHQTEKIVAAVRHQDPSALRAPQANGNNDIFDPQYLNGRPQPAPAAPKNTGPLFDVPAATPIAQPPVSTSPQQENTMHQPGQPQAPMFAQRQEQFTPQAPVQQPISQPAAPAMAAPQRFIPDQAAPVPSAPPGMPMEAQQAASREQQAFVRAAQAAAQVPSQPTVQQPPVNHEASHYSTMPILEQQVRNDIAQQQIEEARKMAAASQPGAQEAFSMAPPTSQGQPAVQQHVEAPSFSGWNLGSDIPEEPVLQQLQAASQQEATAPTADAKGKEEVPEIDIYQMIVNIGGPNREMIEAAKREHNCEIIAVPFSEDEIYLIRPLESGVWRKMQSQWEAAGDKVTEQMRNEQLYGRCVLWPRTEVTSFITMKAGTLSSIVEAIYINSNFLPTNVIAQMTVRL